MADDAAIKAFLQGIPDDTGPGGNPIIPAGVTGPGLKGPAGTQRQLSFVERNTKDGVPLDDTEGANAWVKFQVAARKKPEDKLQFLKDFYGGEARMADTGDPIVRILDPTTGKPKDLAVIEKDFSFSDIGTLLGYGPEILGSILSIRGGQKIPRLGRAGGITGIARDITFGAVGQEAGGLTKDIAASGAPLTANELWEMTKDRGKRLPTDVAIDAGLAVGGKILGKVITPFGSGAGPVQAEAKAGAKFAKDTHDLDFPLTPGELTGSGFLQRGEAILARQPGSSSVFDRIVQQKIDTLKRWQNRMLGIPDDITPAQRASLSTEETVGEAAGVALQRQAAPEAAAVTSAAEAVGKAGQREIESSVARVTKGAPELYPNRTGAAIRTRVEADRAAFEAASANEYNALFARPGGSDRILISPSLQGRAQGLLDDLAAYKTPAGTTERFSELLPTDVERILNRLAEAGKGEMSLRDLVGARTGLSNKIAKEVGGLPGVKVRELERIRALLTDTIEEAATSSPDSGLKAAWKTANVNYAKGAVRYDNPSIKRLFKAVDERGFVPDEDIIKNVSPSEYEAFKAFLGDGSPEFTALKRSIADDIMLSATPPGGQFIDGRQLAAQLDKLYKNKRSIADDIFGKGKGSEGERLMAIAKAISTDSGPISTAMRAAAGEKDIFITKENLAELIKSGVPLGGLRGKLSDLLAAQDKFNTAFKKGILKDVREGALGDKPFDAKNFIGRLYNDLSPKEAQEVMAALSHDPATTQEVRRLVAERVLYDAQRAASRTDTARIGMGDPFRASSGRSLEAAFGNEENKKKLLALLGPAIYRDLDKMSKVIRPGEISQQAFSSAGGLSSGMMVNEMIRGGILGYLQDLAKQKVAALIITTPGIRQWMSNAALNGARGDSLTRGLIMSAPFLEALDKEFGADTGKVIDQIRAGVGQHITATGQKPGQLKFRDLTAEREALLQNAVNVPLKSQPVTNFPSLNQP